MSFMSHCALVIVLIFMGTYIRDAKAAEYSLKELVDKKCITLSLKDLKELKSNFVTQDQVMPLVENYVQSYKSMLVAIEDLSGVSKALDGMLELLEHRRITQDFSGILRVAALKDKLIVATLTSRKQYGESLSKYIEAQGKCFQFFASNSMDTLESVPASLLNLSKVMDIFTKISIGQESTIRAASSAQPAAREEYEKGMQIIKPELLELEAVMLTYIVSKEARNHLVHEIDQEIKTCNKQETQSWLGHLADGKAKTSASMQESSSKKKKKKRSRPNRQNTSSSQLSLDRTPDLTSNDESGGASDLTCRKDKVSKIAAKSSSDSDEGAAMGILKVKEYADHIVIPDARLGIEIVLRINPGLNVSVPRFIYNQSVSDWINSYDYACEKNGYNDPQSPKFALKKTARLTHCFTLNTDKYMKLCGYISEAVCKKTNEPIKRIEMHGYMSYINGKESDDCKQNIKIEYLVDKDGFCFHRNLLVIE